MSFAVIQAKQIAGKFQIASGATSYTVVYAIQFTGTYSETALAGVLGTSGLPAAGSQLGTTGTYASTIEGDIDSDSGRTGTATLPGYATIQYQSTANQTADSGTAPLDRPAEIEWGGSDDTEATRTAIDGSPIINSAHDFYDPPCERYVRGGEVSITVNQSANPASICSTNSYTVNSDAWYGVAAGNGMFGKITATKVVEKYAGATYTFWRVTYPIKFKRDSFRRKLIDNGYRKLVDDKPRHAHDDMGQPTYVPILLDGSGGELAVGGTPVSFPTAGYKVDEETSWGSLSLPNPFA